MEISDIKVIFSQFKKRQEPNLVYLVKNNGTGLFKIGITSSLESRINTLSKACGSRLEILKSVNSNDARACERLLHGFFCECRKDGEWFGLTEKNVKDTILVMDVAHASFLLRAVS